MSSTNTTVPSNSTSNATNTVRPGFFFPTAFKYNEDPAFPITAAIGYFVIGFLSMIIVVLSCTVVRRLKKRAPKYTAGYVGISLLCDCTLYHRHDELLFYIVY